MKTQTVTISDTANAVKSEIPTKDVPIVHTETKTITYEAAQVGHGSMFQNQRLSSKHDKSPLYTGFLITCCK